ncbi:unnamed protein product, partial [Prorocentrum cordatum]
VHFVHGQGGRVGGVAANLVYRFRRLPTAHEVWAALRRGAGQGYGALPVSPFLLTVSAVNCAGLPAGTVELADPALGVPPLPAAGLAAPPAAAAGPLALAAPPGAVAAAGGPGAALVPVAEAPPLPAPPAAPMRAPAVPDSVPLAPLPTGEQAAGWHWIAAEDVDGAANFGAKVAVGVPGGATLVGRVGRRGLLSLAGGLGASVVLLQDAELPWLTQECRGSGACTLEIPPGAGQPGENGREWREVVGLCREEAAPGFGVAPPRAAQWCAKYQVKEGGPVLHHEMWKSKRKLNSSDFGIDIHETISKMLELMGFSDHLEVFNFSSAEIGYRKLQLIERYWCDRRGLVGSRSPSTLCPELLDTVSKELERIHGIKKNARKLREEQKAANGRKVAMMDPPPGLPRPRGEAAEVAGGGDDHLQRALLPLPVPDWCYAAACSWRGWRRPCSASLSRPRDVAGRARLRARDGVQGSDAPPRCAGAGPNLMQQLCLEFLAESCAAMVGAGYSDGEPVTVAPFARDLASLPAVGGAPVPRGPAAGPYLDPALRQLAAHLAFVEGVGGGGALEFQVGEGDFEGVGLCAAWKKDGRQRLVIDCRGSNFRFDEPEKTCLASGGSFSSIELAPGEVLWAAGVNVADAFYNVRLPSELRHLVALPRLRASQLG